jgi:hypothetical protein
VYKVGDRVETESESSLPKWMREGIIITKVIPNKHGSESATEYEVDFERFKAIFYQVECGLLSPLSTARLSGTARRNEKNAIRGVEPFPPAVFFRVVFNRSVPPLPI